MILLIATTSSEAILASLTKSQAEIPSLRTNLMRAKETSPVDMEVAKKYMKSYVKWEKHAKEIVGKAKGFVTADKPKKKPRKEHELHIF